MDLYLPDESPPPPHPAQLWQFRTRGADSLDLECHHTTAAAEEVDGFIGVFVVDHLCQAARSATHRAGQHHLGLLSVQSKRRDVQRPTWGGGGRKGGVSHLFVLLQTLHVAQSFGFVFHLQQQRLDVTVGAAVHAAGHRQVVQRPEAGEAAVAADLVDAAVKNHLVFALRGEIKRRRRTLQSFNTRRS